MQVIKSLAFVGSSEGEHINPSRPGTLADQTFSNCFSCCVTGQRDDTKWKTKETPPQLKISGQKPNQHDSLKD